MLPLFLQSGRLFWSAYFFASYVDTCDFFVAHSREIAKFEKSGLWHAICHAGVFSCFLHSLRRGWWFLIVFFSELSQSDIHSIVAKVATFGTRTGKMWFLPSLQKSYAYTVKMDGDCSGAKYREMKNSLSFLFFDLVFWHFSDLGVFSGFDSHIDTCVYLCASDDLLLPFFLFSHSIALFTMCPKNLYGHGEGCRSEPLYDSLFSF